MQQPCVTTPSTAVTIPVTTLCALHTHTHTRRIISRNERHTHLLDYPWNNAPLPVSKSMHSEDFARSVALSFARTTADRGIAGALSPPPLLWLATSSSLQCVQRRRQVNSTKLDNSRRKRGEKASDSCACCMLHEKQPKCMEVNFHLGSR